MCATSAAVAVVAVVVYQCFARVTHVHYMHVCMYDELYVQFGLGKLQKLLAYCVYTNIRVAMFVGSIMS